MDLLERTATIIRMERLTTKYTVLCCGTARLQLMILLRLHLGPDVILLELFLHFLLGQRFFQFVSRRFASGRLRIKARTYPRLTRMLSLHNKMQARTRAPEDTPVETNASKQPCTIIPRPSCPPMPSFISGYAVFLLFRLSCSKARPLCLRRLRTSEKGAISQGRGIFGYCVKRVFTCIDRTRNVSDHTGLRFNPLKREK